MPYEELAFAITHTAWHGRVYAKERYCETMVPRPMPRLTYSPFLSSSAARMQSLPAPNLNYARMDV